MAINPNNELSTRRTEDKPNLLGVENFGNRLKHLIGEGSINSFAEACGIKPPTLRKYLGEKSASDETVLTKATPGIDKVLLISRYTGRSLAWLITGEEEKQISEEAQKERWLGVFADMNSEQKAQVLESFIQNGIQGTVRPTVLSDDKSNSWGKS